MTNDAVLLSALEKIAMTPSTSEVTLTGVECDAIGREIARLNRERVTVEPRTDAAAWMNATGLVSCASGGGYDIPLYPHPSEKSSQQVGKLAWNDDPANHALNCPCAVCVADPVKQALLATAINSQRAQHTVEDDFQHFLAYSNLKVDVSALRWAFYAGKGLPPPQKR